VGFGWSWIARNELRIYDVIRSWGWMCAWLDSGAVRVGSGLLAIEDYCGLLWVFNAEFPSQGRS
jgi:hypothetical protein